MRRPLHKDLIYDVGVGNGDDSAYYLSCGFRVLSIEGSPGLAEAARHRFSKEIATGRLTLVNVGIAATCGEMTWYLADSGTGTLVKEMSGPDWLVTAIPCVTFDTILDQYGVPFYLKVDIEGSDDLCLDPLRPDETPTYLSLEFDLKKREKILGRLLALGYRRFKLTNQETGTTGVPIYQSDWGFRALRKLSNLVPAVGSAIQASPDWWKGNKDKFLRKIERVAPSGAIGEESFGPWLSESELRQRLQNVSLHYASEHPWYDLQAAL